MQIQVKVFCIATPCSVAGDMIPVFQEDLAASIFRVK
jgi:hypothetical protein